MNSLKEMIIIDGKIVTNDISCCKYNAKNRTYMIKYKGSPSFYNFSAWRVEFITNPDKYNLHIYDYCKSNKIGKDFIVYHNNEKQQQLNRYYFSKNEPYLFKQKHGIGTMQHVNVGEGVRIFNNYEKKEWLDYKINYQYYISSVQKIIDQLNNNNQLTLF